MRNIILCGMAGCGKSTVGGCLAKLLNLDFLDTDEILEKKYGKIAELFVRRGEEYFRDLEAETLKALLSKDGFVIATGGGIVLREENRKILKKMGQAVFLRASAETLAMRLEKDTDRPLLQGVNSLKERLSELLEMRTALYEETADFAVDTEGRTPEQIAEEIVKRIGQV